MQNIHSIENIIFNVFIQFFCNKYFERLVGFEIGTIQFPQHVLTRLVSRLLESTLMIFDVKRFMY